MRIHYLQHVPSEGPGWIENWAISNGHSISGTRLFANEAFPSVTEIDWLVIMGGPMNIYEHEKHPWLIREKAFLREAIDNKLAVLGICLGSQLIADVLGAKVRRNPEKEIGWFPVEFTSAARSLFRSMPAEASVFHWHGDTFDLPPGAIHLAASAGCKNQAFLLGDRVIGLQFHIEVTRELVEEMVRSEPDDITKGRFVQSAEELMSPTAPYRECNALIETLLEDLKRRSKVSEGAGA